MTINSDSKKYEILLTDNLVLCGNTKKAFIIILGKANKSYLKLMKNYAYSI